MNEPGRHFFKAEWHWGRETENWLKKLCIGRTLNFPCGMSYVGDVRADKDESVKPDILADVRSFEFSFKRGEFDTVICDPPFSFWALNKVYSWFPEFCRLAKKRLIFRCPLVALRIPQKGWKKEYVIVGVDGCMFLDMYHIFTNPNGEL